MISRSCVVCQRTGIMIVTAGELLVEFVSHQIDCALERVGPFSGPYPSGAPAIAIDQAARVGASTKIYGAVGEDAFGRSLLERLATDGVDVSAVQRLKDRTTGTAFVSYFEDGDRTFVFHINGTAAECVEATANDSPPFTLHVSGATLGLAPARRALLSLAEQNQRAGGTICCDPNVRPELMKDDTARRALVHLVGRSQILLPSDADIRFLYPELTADECLEHLLSNGAEIVALKKGRAGVRVKTAEVDFTLPAHEVEEVDPTGAGDCFCGALLGMLDCGADLVQATTYANAAGALHVTARGPMELNPSRREIEEFLARERRNGYSGPAYAQS